MSTLFKIRHSATKNAVNTRIVRPAFHVTSVDAAIHGLWRQPRKNPGAPQGGTGADAGAAADAGALG